MDLDFGHGFIPRIGRDNYKAVDLCLGPANMFDGPLSLPWAIVDAPWAEKNPQFLEALEAHGTKTMLDASWWRYRYSPTFEVQAMATCGWAPEAPVTSAEPEMFRRAIRECLRAQAKMNPGAYLVPGLVPNDKHEDLRAAYELIAEVVGEFDELPPKPMVLFIGAHSEGLDLGARVLDGLPAFFSGVYLQVGPTAPVTDSPTKLLRVGDFYARARTADLAVIAGHAGAIAPELRAIGIDAADAGLASSETFDASSARRPSKPRAAEDASSGGPSSRIYLPALARSFDSKRVSEMTAVPAVRDLIGTCRLPCHRFIGGDAFVSRAREHSLRTRVAEAEAIAGLPMSMRLDEVIEAAKKRRSTVTAVNGALMSAKLAVVDTQPLDGRLNWLARLRERQPAA